jgi:hypothetical protein
MLPLAQPSRLGLVGFGPYVPKENSARFQPIGTEFKYAESPEYFVVEGRGFEIDIDGYQIRNVLIKNARIKYDGGSSQLQKVYFLNCTFNIAREPNAQSFAVAILSPRPATTFSAG